MASVDAYTHLQEVATAAQDAAYPNVEAVLKVIAPNEAARQNELGDHAKGCVRPAVQHFLRKFNAHHSPLYANIQLPTRLLAYAALHLWPIQTQLPC